MSEENLGILHPGVMGISVACTAKNSGFVVHWASQGRSSQTRTRAEKFGLIDLESLEKLCEICSVIICVCPPNAAEVVSQQVMEQDFKGLYIDANAVSPQRVKRIGKAMEEAGISFVDGCIIGGPAWEPNTTRMYLSGSQARRAASYFSAGPLETQVMGASLGEASSLKMCYAAYTKGTTALLCAILATAESLNVRAYLDKEWSRSGSGLADEAARRVRRITAKAWRFKGEMEEIAATFKSAGMPAEFHLAAADVYGRIAKYKDAETPELEDVLDTLLSASENGQVG